MPDDPPVTTPPAGGAPPPPAPPPAPGAPPGDPPPPPPPPAKLELTQAEFDAKIAERLERDRAAQKGALTKRAKELGFENVEAMEAAAAAQAATIEAQKTQAQKDAEARTKLEAELATTKAAHAALEDRIQRARDYQTSGVNPDQLEVVDVLLDAARAKDPNLDRAAWLADQKAKRPFLFGTATATTEGANSGAGGPPPPPPAAGGSPKFNALDPKANQDQLVTEGLALGIDPRFLGPAR